MCYDSTKSSWEALVFPFPKWEGCRILAHGEENRACNPLFRPNLLTNKSRVDSTNSIWISHPTVKACVFTLHIGHGLLELLLPTFLLLLRFSLQHSSKIRILLDHQSDGRFGTNETLYPLLGALSPHTEVLPLQNYLEEVSRQNPSKRFICFKQFLFGTKQTAPPPCTDKPTPWICILVTFNHFVIIFSLVIQSSSEMIIGRQH
jgi:hypothetical protein